MHSAGQCTAVTGKVDFLPSLTHPVAVAKTFEDSIKMAKIFTGKSDPNSVVRQNTQRRLAFDDGLQGCAENSTTRELLRNDLIAAVEFPPLDRLANASQCWQR